MKMMEEEFSRKEKSESVETYRSEIRAKNGKSVFTRKQSSICNRARVASVRDDRNR